jgi:ParB family chromosome partitioning protein
MSKEKPKPRLGRGLASLLGGVTTETGTGGEDSGAPMSTETVDISAHQAAGPQEQGAATAGLTRMIGVDRIAPNPYQPRLKVDPQSLAELIESIRQHGVLQPIVVRSHGMDFELVAGQRRLEAARQLGLGTIPAIVRQATDQQVLEIALIENIQREDLNCVDRALAYKNYQDTFNISPEEIAERLGQDRTTVTNYLRLLTLPDEVLELLRADQLSMGHARAIVGLSGPQDQISLAKKTVDSGLSVRQVEAIVAKFKAGAAAVHKTTSKTPNILDLEQQMTRSISTKVQILPARKKGKGKVVIEYYSLDDFDRILDRICGSDRENL